MRVAVLGGMSANHANAARARPRFATRMSWWPVIFVMLSACWDFGPVDLLGGLGYGDDDDQPAGCPNNALSPNTTIPLALGLTPVDVDWFPADAGVDVATHGSAAMSVATVDGSPLPKYLIPSSEDPSIVEAVGSEGSASALLDGLLEGSACVDVSDIGSHIPYGGVQTGAAKVRSAVVVPGGAVHELVDDEIAAFAFVPGDLQIGVGYLAGYANTGQRLVDLGATLELPRATQTDWQTLAFPSATIGSYTIAATAGTVSVSASFDVVDPTTAAREVERFGVDPPELVCFAALTGSKAFIVGLPWSFTIDGAVAVASSEYDNCVAIPQDGVAHTITALAGGQFTSTSAIAQ